MTDRIVVLVPPAPAPALGAYAAAALFAERGRSVTLLEPAGATDPERPEEPFLLPFPHDVRPDGAGRLVTLLATATRLPELDRLLDRPPVPCQLIDERHRVDLAVDPVTFAAEVAREWPHAAGGLAALDRELGRLDAAVAAAPPRLLAGAPGRLGWAGDLAAAIGQPVPWMRGRKALAAPLPEVDGSAAAAALRALALALGGLGDEPVRLGALWRPWAAARRGAIAGARGGLVASLRGRALSGGAARETYDPETLALTGAPGGLGVRTGSGAGLSASLVVSGWPVAGLAPRAEGRLAGRLARLAARVPPRRWAARLVLTVPRRVLPVGLGPRAVIAGETGAPGGPLLLETDPAGPERATLRLTALVDDPVAPPDLGARLHRRLEWLIPFLPERAEATLLPPDPRLPVRFALAGPRPVALPPRPARGLALVGPDVAPALGPEGEVLAALSVAGTLAPVRR